MNVLHVIQRYPPAIGGAETWCRGLARWQAARGDAVTVLASRAVTDGELWDDPPHAPGACAVGATDVDDGVRVLREPVAAPLGPAGQRLLAWARMPMLARAHAPGIYGRLLRCARRADVVHAHAVPGPHAFAAWIAARLARRPFVLTPFFHAGDADHESPAVRRLLGGADAVVTLTEAEAAALRTRGVDAGRIVVATNALPDAAPPAAPAAEVRRLVGVPADRPLVVFVGRKSPAKGLELLLTACAQVRPAPALVLVGPSTAWSEALVRDRRDVTVLDVPAVSEDAKEALVAAADVLVLPSKHESFGGVFLEAWRAGTPVIGADIPAVREVIGDAGSLFRPDDADDLARRIAAVLADPSAARAAAARGRARLATAFVWHRVGEAVDEAYARARGRRSRTGAAVTRSVPCP